MTNKKIAVSIIKPLRMFSGPWLSKNLNNDNVKIEKKTPAFFLKKS